MLELHRWRQIDWRPSAVVALATSVDGRVVAAARENGAIELWNVAPGSAGWHCFLTIPGKEDAAISSLVWCKSWDEKVFPLGRLFSAGLDGSITEWDLQTLQPKEVVESYGGSVWQLTVEPPAEPIQSSKTNNGSIRMQNGALDESDASSDEDGSDDEDERHVEQEAADQRVAVGCDDGCLRLFTVSDNDKGMVYRRTFPRVKGRILSVAWSVDGSKIYSGGSDGCIHCWDSFRIQELFRITAGIGGLGGGAELCVWSLLVLRDGTIVSGDSSGSTQFWEGKHGTLIQALAKHGADVLALAASPSHRGVYAAGADGQIVLYQHVDQSLRQERVAAGPADTVLTDKWVFVGSKRTHTHDVRALSVAFPCVSEEGQTTARTATERNAEKRIRKRDYHGKSSDQKRWLQPGAAMLISGGNDSKLFTYPANAFLAFHPHEICPAPQRPHVQLTSEAGNGEGTMFMVQYPMWVDVWTTHTNSKNLLEMKEGLDFRKDGLGKRKSVAQENYVARKKSNGALQVTRGSDFPASNGRIENSGHERREMAKSEGISPELLARIKSKSIEHICCSAISGNGRYVAFSDRLKPRLYQLQHEKRGSQSSKKTRGIAKKKLPAVIPAAQSMQFTHDNTRLLLGRPHQILVIDVEDAKLVHSFQVDAPVTAREGATGLSPLKLMCTSADSQWVAAITSSGYVHVFSLETMKHHWSIPVPDGSVATSAIFRLSSSNVLIISTSTNQIHVLNVEDKELSEWSAVNGAQMSRCMEEFPGPIIGLSVPRKSISTSVIAYSPRAMCKIDFSKRLRESTVDAREDEISGTSAEASPSSAQSNHGHPSENGVAHRVNGHSNVNNNFVVVHFKNPVLFLGHTGPSSVLVVEKPWLDVLRKFPAPIFRHLYGT